MEETIKISDSVQKYALGGFLRLGGGVLRLYEDRVEFSHLFGTVTIELSELEYVKATKILGFLPWGLEFKSKSGKFIRVYFSSFLTGAASRKIWLDELVQYARSAPSSSEEKSFYTDEEAKKILAELKRQTARPSLKMTVSPVENGSLGLCESKIGGLPYWDLEIPYPTGEDGKPLVLLAQINFAGLPHLPDFPKIGLLQFFIHADDSYGLDFDNTDEQKNYRVVYHERINENVTAASIRALGVKTAADLDGEPLPFYGEFAPEFSLEDSVINPECEGFAEAVKKAAASLSMRFPNGDDVSPYGLFSDETFESMYPDEKNHRLGGYPFFTQADPRDCPRSAGCSFDTLLFQLDSQWGSGGKDYDIIWGDCGIANFFISREDLLRKDFSRVLYNWDCY